MKIRTLAAISSITALSLLSAHAQAGGASLPPLNGPAPLWATNAIEAAVRSSIPPLALATSAPATALSTNHGVLEIPAAVQAAPLPAPSILPQELTVSGANAVARFGPFTAAFAANANTPGAIELSVPSRNGLMLMRSHLAGLSYYDSNTGQAVLLATPQDSVAQVIPPHIVLFTNSLAGIDADLRYTCSAAGQTAGAVYDTSWHVSSLCPPPVFHDSMQDPVYTRVLLNGLPFE